LLELYILPSVTCKQADRLQVTTTSIDSYSLFVDILDHRNFAHTVRKIVTNNDLLRLYILDRVFDFLLAWQLDLVFGDKDLFF
jgi:hypothetical protein